MQLTLLKGIRAGMEAWRKQEFPACAGVLCPSGVWSSLRVGGLFWPAGNQTQGASNPQTLSMGHLLDHCLCVLVRERTQAMSSQ